MNQLLLANRDSLIFVVGSSRSGTTMMGRILGNHQAVFTFRELHFCEELWTPDDHPPIISRDEAVKLTARLLCIQYDGYLNQRNPKRFFEEAKNIIREIPPEAITSSYIFETFLRYEAAKGGKTIPCDHTPRNVFYIGEILRLYPEARIINMIRDPRDVLLSQKKRWKRRFLGAKKIPVKEVFRSWINYHPHHYQQTVECLHKCSGSFCQPTKRIFLTF